jgi:hypothetical protein
MQGLTRRSLLKLGALLMARSIVPPLPTMRPDGEDAENVVPQRNAIFYGRVFQTGALVRKEPNVKADKVRSLRRDDVLPIYAELQTDSGSAHNKTWYQVDDGYMHSALVQPVSWQVNRPRTDAGEDGFWAEVSVPFVDVRTAPSLKAPRSKYRYYSGAVFKVIKVMPTLDQPEVIKANPLPFGGDLAWWYQIEDELFPGRYFVPASQMRPIAPEEFTPLSPDVDPLQKKIVINLREQRMVAYEGEREVFSVRVATGTTFKDAASGRVANFTTTPGTWYVYRKTPSQHMHNGAIGSSRSFDLPGVPWVSYFTASGIAFHGTYWHNDYGIPRSHGCVNLTSEAAKWVWRWTMPPNDYAERYTTLPAKARRDPAQGTTVIVQRG